MIQAIPTVDPSDPALAETVDRLRAELPTEALVGGAAVENLDLQAAFDAKLPWSSASSSTLGFILLLVALQAPLIALLGTVTSLLSTAAAFGVARLVFQDGVGADLLRFEPQGFLDGLGTGLLLRHDLRDRHGLHRVPPRLRQGALRVLR